MFHKLLEVQLKLIVTLFKRETLPFAFGMTSSWMPEKNFSELYVTAG